MLKYKPSHILTALISAAVISLFQLTTLEYVHLLVKFLFSGEINNGLLSDESVTKTALGLIPLNLFTVFVFWVLPEPMPKRKIRRIMTVLGFVFMAVFFTWYLVRIPFAAAQTAVPAHAGFPDSITLGNIIIFLTSPGIILRNILVLGINFFLIRTMFIWLIRKAHPLFFKNEILPFENENNKIRTKSGLDFLDLTKFFVTNVQRNAQPMGIMAIRLKNELSIINTFGVKTRDDALEAIFRVARNISRVNEDQMFHQQVAVFSMLFADEAGALLAAERFSLAINEQLEKLFPGKHLKVSTGVFGHYFDQEPMAGQNPALAAHSLYAGALDISGKADELNRPVVEYSREIWRNA